MHIDLWTLGLQAINAIVLIWLLARFLFRPIMAIIAERRAASEKLLAEANAARDQARADAADIARQRQEGGAVAEHMLEDARKSADAERNRLLERGMREAAQALGEAEAAIARERDVMETALDTRAGELAVTIARRLLEDLPAATITLAMLRALEDRIAAMPEADRRRLASPDDATEVVTAAALDEAGQAMCRDMLATVLGVPVTPRFSVDPTLIAGIELHLPHASIRNTWRDSLERIGRELKPDDEHDARSRRVA